MVKIFDSTSIKKDVEASGTFDDATPLKTLKLPSGARPTAVKVVQVEVGPQRSETFAFVVNTDFHGMKRAPKI